MSAQQRGHAISKKLLRALLQSTLNHLLALDSVASSERARVLKAALAAIRDRPEDVLTVGDLCRIARASQRTLHYAFTERFGLPPAHYMKAYRLTVRNDLCREHEPLMKIADAANKWGSWHLGQFAKDYRNCFGELPSEPASQWLELFAASRATVARRGRSRRRA
jgi:AraC family ethanolamine operon transcriptional activator